MGTRGRGMTREGHTDRWREGAAVTTGVVSHSLLCGCGGRIVGLPYVDATNPPKAASGPYLCRSCAVDHAREQPGGVALLADAGQPVRRAVHRDLVVEFGGPRPPIVVLCGSTRFGAAFRAANLRLTSRGYIVLSVGCDLKADGDLLAGAATGRTVAEVKAGLDELHRRKIDLADEVHVLNVDGYIGDSTRAEIRYATSLGKPVSYLVVPDGNLDSAESPTAVDEAPAVETIDRNLAGGN
jgi:hypothetical protein